MLALDTQIIYMVTALVEMKGMVVGSVASYHTNRKTKVKAINLLHDKLMNKARKLLERGGRSIHILMLLGI